MTITKLKTVRWWAQPTPELAAGTNRNQIRVITGMLGSVDEGTTPAADTSTDKKHGRPR
jgi:hypothetical protein